MTPEVEFGLYLGRREENWRAAFPVMYGQMLADGTLEPSLEFCRANADGEGDALVMKMQYTRG